MLRCRFYLFCGLSFWICSGFLQRTLWVVFTDLFLTLASIIVWSYGPWCQCWFYCFALFHVWLNQHDNIVLFLLVDLLWWHVWLFNLSFLWWINWSWLVHNAYWIFCFFRISFICSMRLYSWRLTMVNHTFAWRSLSTCYYFRCCMTTSMEWIRIDLSDAWLFLSSSSIRCSVIWRRFARSCRDRWLIRSYYTTSGHSEVCRWSTCFCCRHILDRCRCRI